MSGYFLLEISVVPTANPTSVLTDASNAVQKGFKGSNGEIRYLFKIVGENVLCCLVKGPIDNVMKELNLACGSFVNLKSHPLRLYENFATKILNVDEALATPPAKPFKLDGDVFLLEFKVEYRDKTMDEIIGTWQREAQTAFTVRNQGMELELFKVVAERRVYLLVKADGDTIDNIMFTLPIMKENGNQTQVTTRAVSVLH